MDAKLEVLHVGLAKMTSVSSFAAIGTHCIVALWNDSAALSQCLQVLDVNHNEKISNCDPLADCELHIEVTPVSWTTQLAHATQLVKLMLLTMIG